jgi:hydroxyacid-oxoacid transhydrogenase
MYQFETVFQLRFVPLKFGVGASSEVGYDLRELGARRVLVVTDSILKRQTRIVDAVVDHLVKAGLEVDVWDGVEPEPTEDCVVEGVKYASGRRYDAFVGLGGGSSIDVAKLIDLYTTHPTESIRDYFAPPIGKGKPIPGPIKPLVAIPTTAGTGSEVTGVAVVIFKTEKGVVKFGLSSKHLVPTLAVLDPALTVDLPPTVTANTGMDALMHAIEAYTARPFYTRIRPEDPSKRPVYQGSNPVTDMLAEKAIELIGRYLPRAYANGYDLEARSYMLLASHLAGMAFANAGTHISHAIAYPLVGLVYERKGIKLPHGLAVSITGPGLLKALASYIPERCLRIAELLRDYVPEGRLTPESASKALANLMKILNMPNGLSELGVTEADIERLVEGSLMQQRLLAQSPVRADRALLVKVIKESMKYW